MGRSGGWEVDVVGELRITLVGEHVDTGEPMEVEVEIPQVRVCPDQEDDFLAANPVLLDWDWEPGRESIVLHKLNKIRIPLTRPIAPWSEGGVVFKQVNPPVRRVEGEGMSAMRQVLEAEAPVPVTCKQQVEGANTTVKLVAAENWTLSILTKRRPWQ